MARVVLITNDSLHGQRVLQAIWQRGIVVDEVLYLTGRLGLPVRRGMGLAGRVLRWPKSAFGTLGRRVRFHRERKAKYAMRCARVTDAGVKNGRRLLRRLHALQPDWIILGGSGILREEVIRTARRGVLNAHPALLPWVRGCGVIGAALEHGVALGATLHYVDRGIDTGAVIERRLIPVAPGGAELDALDQACMELAAEMMADAVESIVRRGEVAAGTAQTVRYPLFRWPDAAGKVRHQALAAAGRAYELYEAWRPLCVDDARGLLPAGELQAPPVLALEPVAAPALLR
ncbi:MAG TPA: formyltransferase family protein [Longimicrobium sp.]|nr:formyltransferase family protein [Longimicrobium sp.]